MSGSRLTLALDVVVEVVDGLNERALERTGEAFFSVRACPPFWSVCIYGEPVWHNLEDEREDNETLETFLKRAALEMSENIALALGDDPAMRAELEEPVMTVTDVSQRINLHAADG
jgi:hypothetical protein